MTYRQTLSWESSLLALLLYADANQLCVSTNCTTCGGMPFAEKVLNFLRRRGHSISRLPVRRRIQDLFQLWSNTATQQAILSELKDLQPVQSDEDRVMPAVRYLIYSTHKVLGPSVVEQALPINSFAARVLGRMEAHYESRLRAYDRHVTRAENAAIDRARRLADRQIKHEERLKQKALRDAVRQLESEKQSDSNGAE